MSSMQVGMGIIASVALVFIVVAASFYLTSSALQSTDVMQQALAKARGSESIANTFGTPIEFGWYVSGSVTYQALFGDADVSVPIYGPKHGGTLYATARRTNGIWQFVSLVVAVDGSNNMIDLR